MVSTKDNAFGWRFRQDCDLLCRQRRFMNALDMHTMQDSKESGDLTLTSNACIARYEIPLTVLVASN